jgi:hypothetical protein
MSSLEALLQRVLKQDPTLTTVSLTLPLCSNGDQGDNKCDSRCIHVAKNETKKDVSCASNSSHMSKEAIQVVSKCHSFQEQWLCALSSSTVITSVHWSVSRHHGSSWSPHMWSRILKAMSSMKQLHTLSLTSPFDGSGMYALHLPDLTAFLQHSQQSLRSLSLDWMALQDVTETSLQDFRQVLQHTKSLQHLDLHRIYFAATAHTATTNAPHVFHRLDRLVHAVTALPRLHYLRVCTAAPRCGNGSRPLVVLTMHTMRHVLSHPYLHTCILRNVHIDSDLVIHQHGDSIDGDDGCAQALRNNTTLQVLHLNACALTGTRNACFLGGLDHNASLCELDLTESVLVHATVLTQALQTNTALQILALSYCRLGRHEQAHLETIHTLVQTHLRHHPRLHTLSLVGLFQYFRFDGSRPTDAYTRMIQAAVELLEDSHNKCVLHTLHVDEPEDPASVHVHWNALYYRLGLNRARIQSLTADATPPHEWLDAIACVTHNLSCVYHVVRQHPLLFSKTEGGTATTSTTSACATVA